jgi:hypothetical protein
MGAAVKACNKALTIKNTGSECNESMGPTAMLIAVPPGATWPKSTLANFTDYVSQQLHAPKGQRWYVLFGPGIPIRRITNNKEADVIFTADDGTQIFIRYGVLNRTFSTTEGGLCFAAALQSLNKSGYSFIEVDNASQIMSRVNTDKSYSALKTTFVYSPSIDLPDFKNPAFTNFAISTKPEEYIRNGVIFQMDDTSLLDLVGLLDVEVYQNGAVTTAGATRATATDTLVIGATGDTVDIKVLGASLAGAPVIQTGTETTATLLAAKVAAAITANAAVNGGFTAVNAAGVLTISAPASKGATINGTVLTATITGTITATPGGPFAGGVTGTAVLKFGIQTECGEDDLIAQFGATLVNSTLVKITNSAGGAVTPSAVTIVGGVGQATIPDIADTYSVGLADAGTLFAATIEGYEETSPALIVVS